MITKLPGWTSRVQSMSKNTLFWWRLNLNCGVPENNRFNVRNFASNFADRMVSIANDLLEGSVFTAIVYIDPNGIDVNTPPVGQNAGSFVDHTKSC